MPEENLLILPETPEAEKKESPIDPRLVSPPSPFQRTDNAPKRSLWEIVGVCNHSIGSFFVDIWGSQFLLLLILVIFSAALFGIDITQRSHGYLVLHTLFMLCAVRCIHLKFGTVREDKIYERLTRSKG